MKTYYEQRAAEYDATSYELVLEEPQSAQDLLALKRVAAAATHGRVLDIGCGTGWLTRFVRGEIVGVDQSEAMLRIAASRIPNGRFIQASIPPLPFATARSTSPSAATCMGTSRQSATDKPSSPKRSGSLPNSSSSSRRGDRVSLAPAGRTGRSATAAITRSTSATSPPMSSQPRSAAGSS